MPGATGCPILRPMIPERHTVAALFAVGPAWHDEWCEFCDRTRARFAAILRAPSGAVFYSLACPGCYGRLQQERRTEAPRAPERGPE